MMFEHVTSICVLLTQCDDNKSYRLHHHYRGRHLNTGIGPQRRQLPSTEMREVETLRYYANLSTALCDIQTG